MTGGVYEIVHTAAGRRYIGSAGSFARRWSEHRRTLRLGKHHSVVLQRAWDKYGAAAFVFRPLLICAPKDLRDYEQRCLDGLKPEYNVSRTAEFSRLGLKHTPESRARMSAAHTGKTRGPLTPEHKANLSRAHIGLKYAPQTAEQRARKSLRTRGRKMSAEFCEAASRRMLGVSRGPLSVEHKAKISAAHRGRPKSPAHCAAISKAQTGVKHTLERRLAQIASHPANRQK